MNVATYKTSEPDVPRPAARPDRDEAREAGWDAAGVFAALLAALAEVRRESTPSTSSGESAECNVASGVASGGANPTTLPNLTANAAETNVASTLTPSTPEAAPEYSDLTTTSEPTLPTRAGEAAAGACTPGESEAIDALDVSVHGAPQHLGDPSRDVSLVAAELASRRLGASPAETEPASLLSFIHECVRRGEQLPGRKQGTAPEAEQELQVTPTDNPPSIESPQFAQASPVPQEGEPAAAQWDTTKPLQETARSLLLREVAELRPHESRTLRLRLKPEELGEVRIELTRAPDGTVSARLDAESAAAARALAGSLTHLRSAMQSAGVAVGQLGVGQHTAGDGGGRGRDAAPDQAPWGAERATPAPESFKHEAGGDRLLTLRA